MADANQSLEQDYDALRDRQRLKAAMHYTAMKICQGTEDKYGLPISQQVVATIAEAVWRQAETFSTDLESFARHAHRSTINSEDVKLLVRRNPYLALHLQETHRGLTEGREEPKKRARKKKTAAPETSTGQ